jgi:hypothetical protein
VVREVYSLCAELVEFAFSIAPQNVEMFARIVANFFVLEVVQRSIGEEIVEAVGNSERETFGEICAFVHFSLSTAGKR